MIRKVKRVLIMAAIIAAVFCFKYWRYVWPVVAGVIGLLFASQGKPVEQVQEIQEKEKELDQAADDRQKQAEILAREDEKRQEAIEDWRERKNRWKSRIGLMLIFCVLLTMATPAWAGVEDRFEGLSREELIEIIIEAENLLDEADQLLTREIELKEYYKQLYLEVEADLRAVRELSGQKDEIIASLEKSNRAWGVVGGVELGNSFQWRLGVARKKGIISIGTGIGGGDAFSVWGEAGLWIR